jgi:hypothetical protein
MKRSKGRYVRKMFYESWTEWKHLYLGIEGRWVSGQSGNADLIACLSKAGS